MPGQFSFDGSMTVGMSPAPFSSPGLQAGPTKLFVGSIPQGMNEAMLREKFSETGQVAEVFLKNDSSDPLRMWGFVTYISPEGAALAVASFNEKMVFPNSTRALSVSFARSGGGPTAASGQLMDPMTGIPQPQPSGQVGGGIGPTKLFIGSIPIGSTKEILKAEFEKFGPVSDIFLKNDASDPARMWGFVNYQDAASAALAVPALNERLVLPGGSRACAVSFARNSQAQHTMASTAMSGVPANATAKLFLGTIPMGTTEPALRKEFERFGQVTEVLLRNDKSDPNRMWGFLTFSDTQSAAMAVSSLHEKLMLAGSVRPIAVSFARQSGGPGGAPQQAPALGGMAGIDHGWRVYYNPEGIPYYHHAGTNRTQWDIPIELTAQAPVVPTDAATQAALMAAQMGQYAVPAMTQPAALTNLPAISAGFGGLDAVTAGMAGSFAPASTLGGDQRYNPY